ncbi:Cell division protein FtsQ [Thalassoglobus neptunius]|uniref:Cell division protein FtsQ n=1 Tax=Thalassoglobus neptunius TaxID=1938619 RepID=A0A5C5X8F6_9PLAN|nr:hypothetical protein [Thalassoglobus neptunius]TWT58631.1 Cell division protein FtsQ [Thalassoglobus neptunius]
MATAAKTPKKKAPAKRKAAKEAAPPKPSFIGIVLRKFVFRPVTLLVVAIGLVSAVLAPRVPAMLPDLSQLEEYQFPLDEMRVNAPNEWVPPTLIDDVLAQSSLTENVSLLDSNLCREVSEALAGHPWIRKAQLVRLTNEPAIQALIDYREPVAFVRTPTDIYAIDVEGVILPREDFTEDDYARFPWILNAVDPESAEAGDVWPGSAMVAAATIAEILTPKHNMEVYWNHFQLRGIILPPNSRDLQPDEMIFELLTVGGSRVVWGKPIGFDDLEPTAEQKLGRMEQYIERFGDFDSPNGPYRIDIRLFDAISLEPLGELRYR